MAPTRSEIKICGLRDAVSLEAAIESGAAYLGFVFYEPSPRHLEYKEAAKLAETVKDRAKTVALTVDADNARFDAIMTALDPDFLQLHGSEAPDRVRELKKRYAKPVIKAVKIANAGDLTAADNFRGVADILLFDAKMPKDTEGALPGGNGVAFDWDILKGVEIDSYMLSGGLDHSNVGSAMEKLHPAILDVSSGVETTPGVKDPNLIRTFIETVNKANKQDHAA